MVDTDTFIEGEQPKLTFVPDREKAALAGIDVSQIARTLAVAVHGTQVGLIHQPEASEDIPVTVELPRGQRPDLRGAQEHQPAGGQRHAGPAGRAGQVEETSTEQNIYHKNLLPVVYVIGEVGGKYESPVYSILRHAEGRREAEPMPGRATRSSSSPPASRR